MLHLFGFHEHIAPLDLVVKEGLGKVRELSVELVDSLDVYELSELLPDLELLDFRFLHELLEVVRLIIDKETVVVKGELGHTALKDYRVVVALVRPFLALGMLRRQEVSKGRWGCRSLMILLRSWPLKDL